MKLQVVSEYLTLSKEGLVKKVDCPIDQGLLLSNLDFDDNIFLYCLSCNYKKFIGIQLYNEMKKAVEGLYNNDHDWDKLNAQHKEWKEKNPENDIKWWSI